MGMKEGIEVPPLRRIDIRAAAVRARAVLGAGQGRIDAEHLLEKLFEFGITVDIFDSTEAPVAANIEACFVPETSTLHVRDTAYAQMCSGHARGIFTFGHELGHIILAHRKTMNRVAPMPSGWLPAFSNSEWQADTFAAEFTMPLDIINTLQLFKPDAIANQFGVSLKAAEIRLYNLRKYSETQERKKP